MCKLTLRSIARLLIATAVLFLMPLPSQAQNNYPSNCCFDLRIGPSGGQLAAVLVGAAVVIGVGTYFIARAPRLTGCVVSRGGALGLQGAPGDPLYLLEGETGTLHAGERVKVIGRRHRNADQQKTIRVSRVAKDYGPCAALAEVSPPKPIAP